MKINSVEIKDAISQYVKESRSIVDTCKKELRELTEEEQARLEELKKLIEEKKGELVKLQEELDAIELPDENIEEEKNNEERKMKETKFSLLGAIRSIVNNQKMDNVNAAVINAGAEEFRKAGVSFSGQIQLPTMENRAAVTVTAEGEDVVATNIFDILTPLKARNVLVEAGAKWMQGLVGNCQVPVMSANNVAWADETAGAADGAGAFTHVELTPKRLTAYIDISKQFLAQDGVGAENVIRQDLINAISNKLESTILGAGVGSTSQPAGMLNGKDATQLKSFADITNMEAKVEGANVIGECKYVMAPDAKAVLRNMPKSTKSTQLVMEGGEIDGTPALVTTNVATKNVIYGDFSNLAIGSWGAVDLTVDPYTQAANGMVRLVVNAFFDAKVLREDAFAYGTTQIA